MSTNQMNTNQVECWLNGVLVGWVGVRVRVLYSSLTATPSIALFYKNLDKFRNSVC